MFPMLRQLGSSCPQTPLPDSTSENRAVSFALEQSKGQIHKVKGMGALWPGLCRQPDTLPWAKRGARAQPGRGEYQPCSRLEGVLTTRDAALGDIHRNKFISPTVRIMKPQKQSLNIYKVIQCPTEIKRTKDEGTEGSPLAGEQWQSHGALQRKRVQRGKEGSIKLASGR